MIRVYISKSKQSDFDELLKLKSELSNYSNVEIVEFQGGTYSNTLLKSCDIVIFIPPKDSILDDEWKINVGRGQIDEFKSSEHIDAILYLEGTFYNIIGDVLHPAYLSTFQNFGYLEIEDDPIDLEYDLSFKKKEPVSISIPLKTYTIPLNQNKKLLIKLHE